MKPGVRFLEADMEASLAKLQGMWATEPALEPMRKKKRVAGLIDQLLGFRMRVRERTSMTFDLTAEQYARNWALPQFYFHLMAAYAILRAEGIELGKADYVAHMFAYLRPPTAGW